MSVIPCKRDLDFEQKVEEIAAILRSRSHELAGTGLSEKDFYDAGYFRAAVESIRGTFAAELRHKKSFMRSVLAHLQDQGAIVDWEHAEQKDRHDYHLTVGNQRIAIEQKGCLDGNNVNISDRPPNAQEFYIWSLCTNPGSSMEDGVWSAIMRLTADMVATGKRIDGLIAWDMLCGSSQRPCPKCTLDQFTAIGPHRLPPPCVYLFPSEIPNLENPKALPRDLTTSPFANAIKDSFPMSVDNLNYVGYELRRTPSGQLQRKAQLFRREALQKESNWTTLRRLKT